MGRQWDVEGGVVKAFQKTVQRSSTVKKMDTRVVHMQSRGPVDITVVEGPIIGRCHSFGSLHRSYCVGPTFTRWLKLLSEKQTHQVVILDSQCNDSY